MGRPPKQAVEMAKTSFNLPKNLKTEFKLAAVKEDRDMGVIVAELIEAYLKRRDPKWSRQDRSNG
jgi:hypothetical protein